MAKEKTETQIQTEILEYLTKRGHLCWRNNNQPTFDRHLNNGYGGYRSQSKWTPQGLADIFCIDKEEYGQLVGLEVKTPKGRPSAGQLLMQRRFHLANARYEFVRSVEEVKALGL
jgi:hypothetical protein